MRGNDIMYVCDDVGTWIWDLVQKKNDIFRERRLIIEGG